jgi:Family of unknown function (DUF5683)
MKKIVLLTFILSSIMFSQSNNNLYLSGSLINDTQFALSNLQDSSESSKFNFSKKTPMLAGLMSFAVPGAGQIYTENYLKAGVFAAVEVGAIVLAVIYNNKGDDQTEFFENYANDNWSAARYARWTTNNLSSLNINLDANEYDIFDLEGNVNWNELNRLEGAIGGYYSHKLAPFDDQQYYEMIGKYSQFNVGWIDFGDENTPYVWATDPLVDQFKYYSKERGKANDHYTVAKWAVITIVSNHFLSALDAAWSAGRYNKKLNLNISVEEETIGFYKEYYPQINLSYNL